MSKRTGEEEAYFNANKKRNNMFHEDVLELHDMIKHYTDMFSLHDYVYSNFTLLICLLPDAQQSLVPLYISYGCYKPLLHARSTSLPSPI
jgi:hypothetical protein